MLQIAIFNRNETQTFQVRVKEKKKEKKKTFLCIQYPPGTAEVKETGQNLLQEMTLHIFPPEIQNSKSLFHRQILTAQMTP